MILITAEGPDENSPISRHFGRAPFFVLAEDGKITKVIKNEMVEHAPGEIPRFVRDLGVKTVVTGGIGEKARELLNSYGINILTLDGTVKDALKVE